MTIEQVSEEKFPYQLLLILALSVQDHIGLGPLVLERQPRDKGVDFDDSATQA